MNLRYYFAELFDGKTTLSQQFSTSKAAVDHFHDKYGTHLLAVKCVAGTSNSLIFSA